jgi:hypothetical protein
MEKPWHYSDNQFVNVTRDNFKKGLKLSIYHDSNLKTLMDSDPDPDWVTLYNRYHPVHEGYVAAYNSWRGAGGLQEGETLNVDQLLSLLRDRVNRWDSMVQVVFAKKTPSYKGIFNNAHKPFTKGEKETRIAAVLDLGTKLTPHAALAACKTEVDAFYTLISTANAAQSGALGLTGATSDALNITRIETMKQMYRNLGFLIDKLYATPQMIDNLFELSEIRRHQQLIFTGTLTPAENEGILIHTFLVDDKLGVKLTGIGQVKLYLASTPNGTDSTPIIIDVDGTYDNEFEIALFGDLNYGTHRYLTAVNNSVGANEIHYEIHL